MLSGTIGGIQRSNHAELEVHRENHVHQQEVRMIRSQGGGSYRRPVSF